MSRPARSPETAFANVMQGRGFGPGGAGEPKLVLPRRPALRAGDVELGEADGAPIGVSLAKLIEGRLLIQGTSGAGKSWTLRRLLEQTAGLIQQIIIDPEGEFGNLAEPIELLRLDASRLDIATLATAAARAREHRASVLLDLSELGPDEQMAAGAAFIAALIAVPREHWHPVLVAIDEAQQLAPFGGFSEATSVRRASIAAIIDLMSRGRKRGLAGVLATVRLARMAKSVTAPVMNYMIGQNTLDLDIRRAAATIGWDARKAFDCLPALAPGDFVAVGPAFSESPATLRVGDVETEHRGAAPTIKPAALDQAAAARLLDLDELLAASHSDAAQREAHAQAPGLRQVRAFIREPGFADAGRVWAALQKVAPDGARIDGLAKHLTRTPAAIGIALELLDRYGAVEFSGEDEKRAVRITKAMLP